MPDTITIRLTHEDRTAIATLREKYSLETDTAAIRKAQELAIEQPVDIVRTVQASGTIPQHKPWFDERTEFVTHGVLWVLTTNSHGVNSWQPIHERDGL